MTSYQGLRRGGRTVLAEVGTVSEVIIPSDRASGRPRGVAFASSEAEEEAEEAIELADGAELGGRTLRSSPAQDRPPRPGGFRGDGRPGLLTSFRREVVRSAG